MNLVTLDFETYWAPSHTLSSMDAITYVMHKDTEIQTLGVKVNNEPTFVLVGDEITEWARSVDLSDSMVIGHNMSGFDSLLLAWRLRKRPKMYGCTQAMARELGLARVCGASLKALSSHLGLQDKLSLEATNTKGRRLADFSAEELQSLVEYNKVDVDNCYSMFKIFAKKMSPRSLRLIDMTIRMLVEPQFVLDRTLVEQSLAQLQEASDEALFSVGLDLLGAVARAMPRVEVIEHARAHLASAPKFAAFLKRSGVPVPMKPSPSNPDKMIPALAKTDADMVALLEHPDPVVAAAAAARLKVKSTQLQTRLKQFLRVSELVAGRMPIALSYYGADTTGRWAGSMRLNHQNLPRVGKKPKIGDALRNSLRAPKGRKVVVADLSGIELRMNHFLWQEGDSMQLFQDDPAEADLYRAFASSLYDVPFADVSSDQRQMGKIAHLQLQYGAGAPKFREIARQWGVTISEAEAENIVRAWRAQYARIRQGWRQCDLAIEYIALGHYQRIIDPWGLCYTVEDGIKTPTGFICYPNLRREETGEWVYDKNKQKVKLYGAKVTENLIQHLSREAMADMLVKVGQKYKVSHTVHDEIVLVVKEQEAEAALAYMQDIMRGGVSWFPELVTWSEGGIGDRYGEAK